MRSCTTCVCVLATLLMMGGCQDAPGADEEATLRDRIVALLAPDSAAREAAAPTPSDLAGAEANELRDPVLSPGEREAIQSAARDYVRSNAVIRDFSIEIEAAAQEHVRATVVPARGETDPAQLYLRKSGGSWQGVALGTGFTPEDFDRLQIPRGVRPST